MITSTQNKLANEKSLYLRQHAENLVNWHPWGNEVLEKAKSENKPILISIGYSSCHWCHVMERESFMDKKIAEFMNEHFVNIKADREERPDIDQLYMNAAIVSSGRSGWPLNCFALPDGTPFYGTSYMPPQEWLQFISSISDTWKNKPELIQESALQLADGVNSMIWPIKNENASDISIAEIKEMYENWKKELDMINGGALYTPKFPMPVNYQFFLRYTSFFKDETLEEHITKTLLNIAKGGIYDHILGGFARYATDEKWMIPHFEKMLYDNAQLVSLYSEAYKQNPNPFYKQAVYETLCFIKSEMTSPEGGFYSSIDADSDGIEGKFYLWKYNEITHVLGKNAELFCEYFSITKQGNFEETNILHIQKEPEMIAAKYGMNTDPFIQIITQCKRLLIEEREKRIKPVTDKKIITAWNALMIKAYIDAYKTFGEDLFIEWAIAGAEFLEENLISKDGILKHIFNNEIAVNKAFLDDYAFTADAFIAIYQATFDEKWLILSKQITDVAINHFYDEQTQLFFYSSKNSEKLFTRNIEITDNVIPSSNSEMARVLFTLSIYFRNNAYEKISKEMLVRIKDKLLGSGSFHANWGILALEQLMPFYEITITGKNTYEERKKLNKLFFPNAVTGGADTTSKLPLSEGKDYNSEISIQACFDNSCLKPVGSVEALLELIK
ncbi:MAG: hypothetical protein A2275_09325 [Bacteroidetes bacterium RIFOXYA12_FULL_35_11]|nr:MAG: hypothetical protein A2X01_13075 [Bacteroidetes bacterium GWF2_35_48]OFY78106.1 MAG: hypothetical protein A2275_09325 [Bacteroidetes bacterium RIFOXYA12_FULL_35_11]OFY98080.1 MAG: hypothetical protein A2491_12990 [Bacteroidetes bacterium RIFOXYC12_FULL_35_7]